jgi:cytoskeletal protein RodZ
MSLINDALKRANQTRKQQPAGTPEGPVMQPQAAPRRSSSVALIVFLAILVLFMAGLGMLLLVRGVQTNQPTVASISPAKQPVMSNSVVKQPEASPGTVQPAPVLISKPQASLQTTVVVTRPSKPIVVNTSVVVTIPVRDTVAQEAAAAKSAAGPVAAMPETTAVATAEKAADAPEEITGQAPPNLKLQGIYYRRTNPSAMINGHNAFVGDEVDGARVIQIDRTSVVVEFNGRKQVLHLP